MLQYDRLFTALPSGTKVIVDVVGAPSWESGSSASNAPPANASDYGAFIHTLAGHWAGRVAAYEVWNEEDSSRWWMGAPNPTAYTQLLQVAYPAIKSADPQATVLLGGLTGNDYVFLQSVYQAGGKGYFDAVGVHTDTACNVSSPYQYLRDDNGRLDPDSFLGYREIHATELANGDDKPIWMTEMSWRTTSAVCPEGAWAGQKPEGVTEAQQAAYLAQSYHCLNSDPYVKVGLWFPLGDENGTLSGLLSSNFSPKLAFDAMRSYARRGDQVTGACGDFSGPKITLYHPTSGQRYNGSLRIKIKASDGKGLQRIRLLYDGHLIRNFDPYVHLHVYPRVLVAEMHWFGARKVSVGRHVLTIIAIDKLRNITRTYQTFVHLAEPHRRHHHR